MGIDEILIDESYFQVRGVRTHISFSYLCWIKNRKRVTPQCAQAFLRADVLGLTSASSAYRSHSDDICLNPLRPVGSNSHLVEKQLVF
jgi:hypothetical protein